MKPIIPWFCQVITMWIWNYPPSSHSQNAMLSFHKAKGVKHTELFWIMLTEKKTQTGRGIKMYRVIAIMKDKNNNSLEVGAIF